MLWVNQSVCDVICRRIISVSGTIIRGTTILVSLFNSSAELKNDSIRLWKKFCCYTGCLSPYFYTNCRSVTSSSWIILSHSFDIRITGMNTRHSIKFTINCGIRARKNRQQWATTTASSEFQEHSVMLPVLRLTEFSRTFLAVHSLFHSYRFIWASKYFVNENIFISETII